MRIFSTVLCLTLSYLGFAQELLYSEKGVTLKVSTSIKGTAPCSFKGPAKDANVYEVKFILTNDNDFDIEIQWYAQTEFALDDYCGPYEQNPRSDQFVKYIKARSSFIVNSYRTLEGNPPKHVWRVYGWNRAGGQNNPLDTNSGTVYAPKSSPRQHDTNLQNSYSTPWNNWKDLGTTGIQYRFKNTVRGNAVFTIVQFQNTNSCIISFNYQLKGNSVLETPTEGFNNPSVRIGANATTTELIWPQTFHVSNPGFKVELSRIEKSKDCEVNQPFQSITLPDTQMKISDAAFDDLMQKYKQAFESKDYELALHYLKQLSKYNYADNRKLIDGQFANLNAAMRESGKSKPLQSPYQPSQIDSMKAQQDFLAAPDIAMPPVVLTDVPEVVYPEITTENYLEAIKDQKIGGEQGVMTYRQAEQLGDAMSSTMDKWNKSIDLNQDKRDLERNYEFEKKYGISLEEFTNILRNPTLPQLQQLLERGVNEETYAKGNALNALHYLAIFGTPDMCKYLVDRGFAINKVTNNSWGNKNRMYNHKDLQSLGEKVVSYKWTPRTLDLFAYGRLYDSKWRAIDFAIVFDRVDNARFLLSVDGIEVNKKDIKQCLARVPPQTEMANLLQSFFDKKERAK